MGSKSEIWRVGGLTSGAREVAVAVGLDADLDGPEDDAESGLLWLWVESGGVSGVSVPCLPPLPPPPPPAEFTSLKSLIGSKTGLSKALLEVTLVRLLFFLGEILRPILLLGDSNPPCARSCRHDMMRSFGGCVDVLSRLVRPVREEMMLLGRPRRMEPVRRERREAASQLSEARRRLW